MPELPEVEGFKEYIKVHCINKKIDDVSCDEKRSIKDISFKKFKDSIIGSSFKKVNRKGKYLIIDLSPHTVLIMNFGLTGSVAYTKKLDMSIKYAHVNFFFKDGSVLYWISKRKFGHVWLKQSARDLKSIKELGPDALTLTASQLMDMLKKNKKKNIKALLMDQKVIAGIGNEYSDEILFQAGIDPHHDAQDLSDAQKKALLNQIKKVLKYAIVLRKKEMKHLAEYSYLSDQSLSDFKSSYLQAHRHKDMVCPKNKKHILKKAKIAGRTSYYCPEDQK